MAAMFRNLVLSLAGALLLQQLQNRIGSEYLTKFLLGNLITILIALLAINTATLGIVLTKIRELMDQNPNSDGTFLKTRKAMMFSIREQIVLVIVASVLFILFESKFVTGSCWSTFVEGGIIAIFIYAITILFDTAKSVFVLLDYKR